MLEPHAGPSLTVPRPAGGVSMSFVKDVVPGMGLFGVVMWLG